ncbi:hypothetical protein M514_19236 [Trichuris suis]|uniref:Peptidase A2 domain-containing protein n=1 Tax=Trichuris suis TaxID=68888 RepID=A0A085NBR9_9BILA|nr:hypothetical protein M514_20781 [Trichuris suis]KFD68603.1 hypothetical protein M514_19236 [Trichuris suis]
MLTAVVAAEPVSRCIHLLDQRSGMDFLVDTGAAVSLLPANQILGNLHRQRKPSYMLSTARQWLSTVLKHSQSISILPPAKWTFILANVETAIIGADFIHHHRLVVDLANSRGVGLS